MAVVTKPKETTKEITEMDERIEVLQLLKESNPEVEKVLESLVQTE